MSEHDEHGRALLAVRDAVAARPHARPDPAFRARLKHEFVTGRFAAPRRPVPQRPWFTRPALLLPMAAGLLLVAGVLGNRGPDWRVSSVNGDGRVVVGGKSFAPGERDRIAAALRRGGAVKIEGAVTLDLVAPGVVAVAIGPSTRMTLPASPGRWWGREMRASVAAGDVYCSTGRAFRGAKLIVGTPELEAVAVGTSFAVLCHPGGSCVCVMQGRVSVSPNEGGEATVVPEGMRRTVDSAGAGETLPILEDSVHRLHQQLSTVGGELDH